MKKLTLILITILLTLSYNVEASIYGTLKGKVLTPEGKPAVGASIFVMGTTKGAYAKADGSFIISNIESGEYDVKISFVGQEDLIVKLRISADIITERTFKMKDSETGIMTEEVIRYADRDMVQPTQIGTQSAFSESDIKSVSTNNVTSLVALTAGVRNNGSGYTVRGSRDNQTQMRVDGVDISDQFAGGFGGVGQAYFPMVSQSAVEEMQVKTGGFSAEYGAALGGVINATVGAGRTDKYKGFFNYRTDMPFLNGSSPSDIRLIKEDISLKLENFGEGYKYQGANQNQFEFGIDGPIPFLKNSTFSLSTNNTFEEFRGNNYEIRDPAGNNLGQLDNQASWVRNITGKFAFQLSQNTRLITGGQWGKTNFQNNSWAWLYATDPGMFINRDENFKAIDTVFNNIPENVYKQGGFDLTVINGYLTLNQTINERSFFEVSARYNLNASSSGRLLDYGNPGYFSGYDFLEPIDNVTLAEGVISLDENGNNQPNQAHDYYEGTEKQNQTTADGFQTTAIPVRNVFSGYYEGLQSSRGTANPYGLNNSFVNHSFSGYSFTRGTYFQLDGSYSVNFDVGDFSHAFKTGFEVRMNEMHRHANGSPNSSAPSSKDIYSDLWGGNLYELNQDAKTQSEIARTPFSFTAYVQDQIKFESLIISPGLRMDYFDPNSKYRLAENADYFIQISEINNPNLFADSKPQVMFSPRVNISYPITKRQIITMNYGIYYKIANYNDMFSNYNANYVQVGGVRIGNPNMKPENVNSYEIGYNYQFTDELAFNLNAYYKDIFNELGVAAVRITPSPYFQTTVSEYGNSRGLEFEIRKARSDNYSFRLNYTLSNVMGTADNVNTNLGINPDRSVPGLEFFPYPLASYSLGRDIPHDFTGIFNIFFLDNDGPSIAGIHFLEQFDFGLTVRYQSGSPFTVTDLNGVALGERNADRFPSVWSSNISVRRNLDLGDIFGESLKGTDVLLYMDILNAFNNRQARTWNTTSKDPDVNPALLETQIGQLAAIPYYKDGDYSNPESFNINQYDQFGYRIYQADGTGYSPSDVDKNGIITQQEMFDALLKYYEDTTKFKGNYQIPIQVWFGVKINFQSLLK